jgi:hypothetical protein
VTCFSISGLAFASLGNLAAGKLKVRSSVSSTQTRLSSIQHRMACGASVSNSAIAMKTTISVDQKIAISLNQLSDAVYLSGGKSVVRCEGNWMQLEFYFELLARHMDVRRLIRFAAVEVKPVGTNP